MPSKSTATRAVLGSAISASKPSTPAVVRGTGSGGTGGGTAATLLAAHLPLDVQSWASTSVRWVVETPVRCGRRLVDRRELGSQRLRGGELTVGVEHRGRRDRVWVVAGQGHDPAPAAEGRIGPRRHAADVSAVQDVDQRADRWGARARWGDGVDGVAAGGVVGGGVALVDACEATGEDDGAGAVDVTADDAGLDGRGRRRR